ncbi:SRPBCC family protein [Luteococcus peritonei]|uniref:SRPBCC family protein n=1 Tax=Luteococcus peritonei TaxID=88874 RepID=A0ABW4RU38_9ACTN
MQPQQMHYSCQVDIAVPRARVVELMTDPERAHEWQPGLERYESVEGERGRPGSVSRLVFAGAPGEGTMTEQVHHLDEGSYEVTYLLGPVRNVNRNEFTQIEAGDALPQGGTRWLADHVFHLPPGMLEQMGGQGEQAFRANTQRAMETFRTWCEANA